MIDFSDVGIIPTPVDYLKNIIHSYCVTIHKMQGSSYPVVLMLSDKAHKFQLNANLLYTGLTRTSKYAVMLSQAETINFGGKKFANMSRKSFLGEMLTELHSDMNEKELA
jgi:ATP-dependent exoDNAse (exonuclease V) alpha subunit